MQTFTIITSRGSTTNLEIDDPDLYDNLGLGMEAARDVAGALYREPIGNGWTHYADGIDIGTYLNNGAQVRIAVIATTDGLAAKAKDAVRAATWVGEINHED